MEFFIAKLKEANPIKESLGPTGFTSISFIQIVKAMDGENQSLFMCCFSLMLICHNIELYSINSCLHE